MAKKEILDKLSIYIPQGKTKERSAERLIRRRGRDKADVHDV